ncbi:Aldehyde/histidinol dehydrogenase [Pyronema domesticum]|uniref:Similar to Salicylaldehyde dehydrogenase acc. no. P0A390 n=1 Tax=Pyronema omphalodes (strain CBS 100304) TaxID=1076935 RepID=U4KYY7_PYROM|nr:Aldehyde/histidinol dehydrogenase [Pyronema domesticum]CCX07221.1 Similar to Salicylaldehyde dehydrogenase; acc. no. P0A390 [Pyronema omphalodes CBS 100304]
MTSDFISPLIINGVERVGPKTGPVISPATGKQIWSHTSASVKDVDDAVSAATAAFPAWKATQLKDRRNLILKAADALEASYDEIAEAMKQETASDDGWAAFNINTSLEVMRGVAQRLPSIEGRIPQCDDPNMTAMVVKEPYGVVLAIAPWNAPIILAIRAIVFPLAAGNTVVFKSSELSPRTHYLTARIFAQAGFPAGTVNLLGHVREDAETITTAIISSPMVRKVNFTGSTPIGRKIAEISGRHLTPATLELGGKAPMIVCEDADLEAAAIGGAFGAMHHAGQICMSTEKILVHESVAEKFTEGLKAAVQKMYGTSQYLIQSSGVDRVDGLAKDAARLGAGVFPEAQKQQNLNEYNNTVVCNANDKMKLWQTESFGPVVMVSKWTDEEEAIKMANDTEYGLSAAVWTKDIGRGIRIARRIESGAVHINGATVHDEVALPHGGVKNSGYGRFGGTWGLEEFMTTKTITFKV